MAEVLLSLRSFLELDDIARQVPASPMSTATNGHLKLKEAAEPIFKEDWKRMFRAFDKFGDGALRPEELFAGVRNTLRIPKHEMPDKMVNKLYDTPLWSIL